jgi:hypothetical protein
MTLLTIPEFRARLNFDPEQDEQVEDILAEVTSDWEKLTGRLWEKNAAIVEEFRFTRDDDKILWLPLTPVTAVTTVEERYLDENTYTTLTSDKYFLSSGEFGRLEKLKSSWKPSVRVTYAGGYDDTDCPDGVKRALVLQARFLQSRLADENLTTKSKSTQGGSTDFFEKADFHPRFKKLAAQWRRKP